MSELERSAQHALERLEILTLGLEEDCGEPDCGDCKPWRPVRESVAQLKSALHGIQSPPITHAEGCWSWGPAHYMCCYNEVGKLRGWRADKK